jgi:hypothetical protein
VNAAFAATSGEDSASSTGAHAQTESMNFGTPTIVGLKRALTHNKNSLLLIRLMGRDICSRMRDTTG